MRMENDLFITKYSGIVSLMSYTNREQYVIKGRLKFTENVSE